MSRIPTSKLAWQAFRLLGKNRRCSKETREDMLGCIGRIARAMERYGLNSIRDIKPGHVQRYFAELKGAGLSESRMANHASAMRKLCHVIGKADVVPSNRVLGCSRSQANRTKHADERMDTAKVAEVYAKLSEPNQIAYLMAKVFALRQKETLLSFKTTEKDGSTWLVVEGAKGGRPRLVPVDNDEQREVLARNHAYRASHGGKLVDEQKSLLQGIRSLQNELAAAGATRTSGANMHTLRREWIIVRCERIAAAPEEEQLNMRKSLMEAVGHSRDATRSYTDL